MSSVVPLRSNQIIDQKLYFGKLSVVHDIEVGKLVNNYMLEELLENSVMVSIYKLNNLF